MTLERDHYCPDCGEDREFYRSASTLLHLGEKVKWTCSACGYGYVEVDGIVSDEVDA